MNRWARQCWAVALSILLLSGGSPAGAWEYRLMETAPPGSVPGGVLYQGRLEQSGIPFNTGDRGVLPMVFKLYECQYDPLNLFNCPALWEGAYNVQVNQGIFGVALNIPVSALSGGTSKYLEVNIQGSRLSPRDQLLSVPYAMVAKTVEGSIEISTGGFTVTNSGGSVLYVSSVTGNVGIGSNVTDIPGIRLHVAGGDVMIGNATTANASIDEDLFVKGRLIVEGNTALNGGILVSVLGVGPGATITGAQLFKVGATGLLTVNDTGRIGIGDTNPQATLDIRAATDPGLILDHATSPRIQFNRAGVSMVQAGYDDTAGAARFGTVGAVPLSLLTGATPRLTVASGGNVGIGTLAPATTLEVNGDAQFGSGATKSTFTAAGALQLATPLTTAYGGTGLSASGAAGNILVSDGTAWASVAMSNHGTLAANGALTLNNTGVTAQSYGDASHVAQFTVDAQGRVTAAASVAITGASPVGSALPAGNIWVGNGGGVAAPVAVSSHASLSSGGALSLNSTGVGAGTYRRVYVDLTGRVTSGDNPTTLGGYGITDALVTGSSTQNAYFGDIYLREDGGAQAQTLRFTVGEDLTADATLTLDVDDNNRTLTIAGDATISGTNTGDQQIQLTGDVTGGPTYNSMATTLADTAVTPGSYGNATNIPQITVDSKGRLTSVTTVGLNCAGATPEGGPLAATKVWVGNASNQAASVFISSHATLASGGGLSLNNTGIAAGSYRSVYVDATGRITSGTNPTTLSGYGITDGLVNTVGSTQDGYFGDIYIRDDVDSSHALRLTAGSNLTGLRTLTIFTGDLNRNLTLSGDATVSGTNTGTQTITLTGDVTGSGQGSFAATLADTAVTAGTYGNATNVARFTVDSKGRLTAASNVAITGVSPVGATLNSGQIWVGNGSNQAAAVTMNTDATLSNTGALTLANSGVGAGTYRSVTVDAKGRVTSGTNPSDLAGYGLDDDAVQLNYGSAQTGAIWVSGNGTFGGSLSASGTGGNVPHGCARGSTAGGSHACGANQWAIGGGGTCSAGNLISSQPNASPPTGWIITCSGSTGTTYAICCTR